LRPHGFAGVLSEYDGNNNLLRKYIYGPGIDQPVCMIEEAESQTYYYHFDALGSVVALSDSSGDTVQTYEYTVYGEVWASDDDFPNPYMFAGRRYDIEIGQYYNRARYYNPYTGRFLQTDPIGYGAGINLYRYCINNPLNFLDPYGLLRYREPNEPLTAVIYTEEGFMRGLVGEWDLDDIYAWYCCAEGELVAHDVAGITIYAEIDDPNIIYTGSLEHTNDGEVVMLTDSEICDILFLIAIEITAPEPAIVYTGYYNDYFVPPDWWPWTQYSTDSYYYNSWGIGSILERISGILTPTMNIITGESAGLPFQPFTNPGTLDAPESWTARYNETVAAWQEYDLWKTFWLFKIFGSE
jgi:RHS repeat-associated protein